MSLSRAALFASLLPTRVTVETSAGALALELATEAAPRTVENFLHYARAGFYEGTVFHRVVPGFVAQAGGYTADRARKAPLRPPIMLEPSQLKHVDGALGMARLPEPHTATSEWYICDGAQPELDGQYCVFGRLLEGRDTLQRILAAPRDAGDWPKDAPVITRVAESGAAVAAAAAGRATVSEAEVVRAAARKLRGRAAMLRARKPLLAISEVEAAIALADRTGKPSDLARAESLLNEKERR